MSMTPTRPTADVGVIVGRFQVHQLHEAHIELIGDVMSRHQRVIIFVGLSPLRNTAKNPLDFNTRKRMIYESFPNVEVYYLEDNICDKTWSKNLDRQIERWLKPYQTAVLYGSRDSFISSYSGNYPTVELESTKYISGTQIRREIANSFSPSLEYRAGVIAASMDRWPTVYTCVDVAILDRSKQRILLGRKEGEKGLRFIGGFSTPDSPSFEHDAKREVFEETGLSISEPRYIGSTFINDWRYKSEQDKIKTLFFVADYEFGRPEANDDIAYVQWVSVQDFLDGTVEIVEDHQVLADMFTKFLQSTIGENNV